MSLGSSLLNNTLIAPGKIFSVNATTGERTAAKGFKMAPTIIAGKLEDSVGGGMCQVSTTVFNAAFEAGLQIVERHNHELYISHYPLGRDATVSYGSYDLKFRNDTPHWILLKTDFHGLVADRLAVQRAAAPQGRRLDQQLVQPRAVLGAQEGRSDPGQGPDQGRHAGRRRHEHRLLPQGLRRRRQADLERRLQERLLDGPRGAAGRHQEGGQAEHLAVALAVGFGARRSPRPKPTPKPTTSAAGH